MRILQNIEQFYGSSSDVTETTTSLQRKKIVCDVLILGAGPAGLSAAIYASRAKLHTIVIDESIVGGQVATTYDIWNYPGTNGVIGGLELAENMKMQAIEFGTEIHDMKVVQEVDLLCTPKRIQTTDAEYFAKGLIIATGATPRKLPAIGESEFRGRGIHYCATCDGAMYQDADIVVVGGGESAVEEAEFLTRFGKKVTIVHRRDHFTASKGAQEELLHLPHVEVIWNSQVVEAKGNGFVQNLVLEDVNTKERKEIPAEGVFVYIGMEPKSDMFAGQVDMNPWGYIKTDEDMKTNIEGVFAAGDVRDKKIRQIATATGDGTIAGIMVEKYIVTLKD